MLKQEITESETKLNNSESRNLELRKELESIRQELIDEKLKGERQNQKTLMNALGKQIIRKQPMNVKKMIQGGNRTGMRFNLAPGAFKIG